MDLGRPSSIEGGRSVRRLIALDCCDVVALVGVLKDFVLPNEMMQYNILCENTHRPLPSNDPQPVITSCA